MSTGNDPALPNPADNQPQAGAEGAVAAQAAAAPETPVVVVDVDDIELNEAKAAAQAEEAGGDGGGQGGAAPGDANGQQQQQQPAPTDQQQPAAGQAPAGEKVMVPIERLNEVLGHKTKAEQQAAYWQGVAEARGQQQPAPQGGQQQQPVQETPQDLLKTVRSERIALAKKFDDGEITAASWEEQKAALDDREQAIREEQLLARVPKPTQAAPAQSSDPLYLETLTAQLENQHPWVKVFEQVGTDQDWDYLKGRAIANLTGRGVDPTKGDLGRYELRKEIAALADQLGPSLVADRAQAQGIALPNAQPPAQQQQQQQTQQPSAQARRTALEKAADAPPDLSQLAGQSGADPGVPSDARLETMSDEDIAALPAGVRNRLKGMAA